MNISKIISIKRKENNISQEELANELGVTKSAVSKWETGLTQPDISIIPNIAKFFNITIDELFGINLNITKEEIDNICSEYHLEISKDNFNIDKLKDLINKYYKCYEFTYQITVLIINNINYINHMYHEEILNYCILNLNIIINNSKNISICKKANYFLMMCHLLLKEYKKVINVIDNDDLIINDELNLLTQAYLLSDDINKSEEINQISLFQHISSTLVALNNSIKYINNKEDLNNLHNQLNNIINDFNFININSLLCITIYLNIAIKYLEYDNSNSITLLNKIYDILNKSESLTKMSCNNYFNKINTWLNKNYNNVISNDSIVKQSIINQILNSNTFISLENNSEYTNLKIKLNNLIKGEMK